MAHLVKPSRLPIEGRPRVSLRQNLLASVPDPLMNDAAVNVETALKLAVAKKKARGEKPANANNLGE